MIARIEHRERVFKVDLSSPLDIALSIRGDEKNPIAWYLKPPRIEPVKDGDWIGKVSQGASTNFNNIYFNPHGHGTHTECLGHITAEFHGVNDSLKNYFFFAKLITVEPEPRDNDLVITETQLRKVVQVGEAEAIVIRTLPNSIFKRSRHYSHTNWAYLEEGAAKYLRESGVQHLLIDLPSVDREKDEGKLLAHKAFWHYPRNPRMDATITELVYVPSRIEDGYYFLNLQLASFENDAAPSRPVLFKIEAQ